MTVSIEEYSNFLEKYISEIHGEYWMFEIHRSNTELEQLKSDKLWQIYNLVETCYNFFIKHVVTVDDLQLYINFLDKLTTAGRGDFTDTQLFVLSVLSVQLIKH